MVTFVETGDFRSPRAGADDDGKGYFTVKCNDVPLASLRRKPAKQKTQRKKVRLTPINEEIDRETSFASLNCLEEPEVCISVNTNEDLYITRRSGTPIVRRQATINKLLSDVADAYEEELGCISEGSAPSGRNAEIKDILRELPPRPKCGRKVLPPSLTGINEETKRTKLLKRRSKLNIKRGSSVSPLKEYENKNYTLNDLKSQARPRSAEDGVRVLRLSDLSAVNSTSVPDLPSIISKLSKSDTEDFREVSEFDDSGALSTPRRHVEQPLGPIPWDNPCLKGNEISSFYNMWERDRTRRPFDKKYAKEQGLKVHRSCMCAIKQFGMKKCSHTKKHFLPPLH